MTETAIKHQCFTVDTDDGVTHLRLSRPRQANSMIPEFWSELPAIVRQLDCSGYTRALVLESEGKHFCSGMDLAVFESALVSTSSATDREAFRRIAVRLQESLSILETCRMPVIAAVQGACIGAGLDLICAADMRYCTADAYFVIQEINLGIMADLGTLQRLPKIIPQGIARQLAFTGEKLDAARAKEFGLINEVFDTREAMMEHVSGVAREIAAKSPIAIAASKEALNFARDHSVSDGLNQVAMLQASVFDRDVLLQCIRAAKEKRQPEFDGLKPLGDKPV